jgi:ATP synthase F subunit
MARAASEEGALVAVIADEDTITGFLLAGVGDVDLRKRTNFLVVDGKTTVRHIEQTFKDFTNREDVAIVLVSQPIANMIRHVIANHAKVWARRAVAAGWRGGGFRVRCRAAAWQRRPAVGVAGPGRPAAWRQRHRQRLACTVAYNKIVSRLRDSNSVQGLQFAQPPATPTHPQAIPAVLEIPSKDSPYDPNQDSLLLRVRHLLGLGP